MKCLPGKMLFYIAGILIAGTLQSSGQDTISFKQPQLPSIFNQLVQSVHLDKLGSYRPLIRIDKISEDMIKVKISYLITDLLHLDNWQVTIKPKFTPLFHWAPHLTPTDQHIIAQHVFRSPALIVSNHKMQLTVMPDLDLTGTDTTLPWYMDLDAIRNKVVLGVSKSRVKEHVLFVKDSGLVFSPRLFEFGFYIIASGNKKDLEDPWRKPLAFLWNKWGKSLYRSGQPLTGNLEPYIRHTYNWAFNNWKNSVWQEFNLNGKNVGAPVIIVNVTQSPNYPGEVDEREFRSIWNQAWFSSLRSAQGLYRYARRYHDTALLRKANLTKELALSFPQQNGLFNSVIATPMETIEVSGKKLNRSTGWQSYYFGNSNRNPLKTWGSAGDAPFHLLDMSWTALLMLTWYEELEKDERLLTYATLYADRLLQLQDKEGFFPAWIDTKSLQPLGILDHSPETSLSVTFLLRLHAITKKMKYREAATKAIDAVLRHIVPLGQWEAFETYYSCSRVLDTLVNRKVLRNNAFKQNTLSMYWTAEASYNMFEATGNNKYLVSGQRTLDELLMYQASWQPPYIPINALGGFGVMNADGEWNDSRQSLFAELIIKYGKKLASEEYIERGFAALKASFVMMYCPENPKTKSQWEKVYPFFNEKDYGFMMENYGHGGVTSAEGLGIGEFTIYDWGNGAAAEAFNRILDHLGSIP